MDYEYSMGNLEQLIRKVVSIVSNQLRNTVMFGENPILRNNLEPITKVTYKQCLEHLSNNGEKIEFGEILRIRRCGSLVKGLKGFIL